MDLYEPRTLDAVNRYVLHERPLDADKQPVRVLGRRNRATSVRAFELPGGEAWLRPPPGTARDPHPGPRRMT